jgi:hypothetical protein
MKDLSHIQEWLEKLRLTDIARNAIENEEVDVGFELMRINALFDAHAPELNGDFVRDQFAAAGILNEGLSERSPRIDRAKNIAARTMKKTRDRAKSAALSAFAAAGSAKDQVGSVFEGHPKDTTNDKKEAQSCKSSLTLQAIAVILDLCP